MSEIAFSNLRSHSVFTATRSIEKRVVDNGVVFDKNELAELAGQVMPEKQELEQAFNTIAAVLRTLEIDADMIASCLEGLSPAQRDKILAYLQQLKRNRQKAHDLHYHYTETCLASSQQHFTNGVTPRERQLAERIMKLRERIAKLIALCHELLTNYKLLGKVQLPKDYAKSLAAIKNLGNILTEVFGGSFKYFANGFKVIAGQEIYVERTGEIYVNDVAQLQGALQQLATRLAQATEGIRHTQTQAVARNFVQLTSS